MKSRKEFLHFIAGYGLYLATGLLFGKTKDSSPELRISLPEGEEAVSESDPTAKALGYHKNPGQIDSKKFPERNSTLAKKQFCKNCYNYSPMNEEWGKCKILTKGAVYSGGWCTAWSSKV